MTAATSEAIRQASERIRTWRHDPVAFVRDNFAVEPDLWQIDALSAIGGPANPRRRLCMKACTGPGKSAVLAWIGWHRLACFAGKGEHPKGAAVSITGDNLKDNLWPELSKWQQRSKFLTSAFMWTKEKIYANDHPETWFLSARSFAKDANDEAIGRALSGLHSQYPFLLLDETGDMPVAVGRAAQQIFTGDPVDALIAQAGNPTSTTGLLYDSCTKGRALGHHVTVTADPDDPKRTPRVSVEHAADMIATYGRDNPWVMATILGLFPPGGFNTLLSIDDVEKAMARHYREPEYSYAAKVIGLDVARFGDDATARCKRQGLVCFPFRTMRNATGIEVAGSVAREIDEWGADATFVDNTGGYGASAIDQLVVLGHSPIGVGFAEAASDKRFANKRAEIHWLMAEWVKNGGALPSDPELAEELCAPTYSYKGDKIIIEPKEKIKERMGRSPDKADALACTFAHPVVAGQRLIDAQGHSLLRGGGTPQSTASDDYNPHG